MPRKAKPCLSDFRLIRGDSRGIFYDLFPPDEAAELTIRATLLRGLEEWIKTAGTRAAAAEALGVTQARISEIRRGKINNFSLDQLVRLAARAGLRPEVRLTA